MRTRRRKESRLPTRMEVIIEADEVNPFEEDSVEEAEAAMQGAVSLLAGVEE